MNDSWLYVEEDSCSSDSYSDKIDSEVEAELYSIIHHQDTISSENLTTLDANENDITSVSIDQINRNDNDLNYVKTKQLDCSSNKFSHFNTTPALNEGINMSCQNIFKSQKHESHVKSLTNICSEKVNLNSIKSLLANDRVEEPGKNFSRKENLQKKFKSDNYSSDSDASIIWTEPQSSNVDFKMNFDTISVSSDSSDILVSSISREQEPVYNNISSNLTIKRDFEDLWHINEEDLYRRKKRFILRRYHSINNQCSICNKKGHAAKFCTMPKITKCFNCGGDHLYSECKNRACSRCYQTGHVLRNCVRPPISHCFHCRMKGHISSNCPDIWRRYHLTTKSKKLLRGKVVKQNKSLYCFNCGWSGHFGSMCKEPRKWGSFCTWPSVLSYDNPNSLLKRDKYTPNNTNDQKEQLFRKYQGTTASPTIVQNSNLAPIKKYFAERRLNRLKMKEKLKQNLDATHGDNKEIQRNGKNRIFRERNFPRTPKGNCKSKNNSRDSSFSTVSNRESSVSVADVEEDPVPESLLLMQKKWQKMRQKRKRKRKAQKIKCINS